MSRVAAPRSGGGVDRAGAQGRPESLTAAAARIIVLVLLWYTFSIGITFYNKWLFKIHGFHFPLSTTVVHMLTTFGMAHVVRLYREYHGSPRPIVSRRDWMFRVAPAGIAGALDIGLSNMSLIWVSLPLYTMCKSTLVVWLLLFAFCLRLEQPSVPLFGVILTICGGLMLFEAKEEVSFHSKGFILVMLAAVTGGLRWVLTQLVLHKEGLGLTHPVDTVFYVAPAMALTLFPFALALEARELVAAKQFDGTFKLLMVTIGTVLFGAVLAFCLTFSEFLLVSKTSGVTLSVAGIFKELCTIALSVMILPDSHLSKLNVAGLSLSLVGIAGYNYIKYTKAKDSTGYERVQGEEMELHDLSNKRLSKLDMIDEEDL
eukprot:m.491581 g.491581  ORF g.491581 m.491581 type:complete len:373 (-) comp30349_c0_seq1:147-1265(-)